MSLHYSSRAKDGLFILLNALKCFPSHSITISWNDDNVNVKSLTIKVVVEIPGKYSHDLWIYKGLLKTASKPRWWKLNKIKNKQVTIRKIQQHAEASETTLVMHICNKELVSKNIGEFSPKSIEMYIMKSYVWI